MGRAHGACEVRSRREKEAMRDIADDEQRRARPQSPCALRVPAACSERDPCHYSDRLLELAPTREHRGQGDECHGVGSQCALPERDERAYRGGCLYFLRRPSAFGTYDERRAIRYRHLEIGQGYASRCIRFDQNEYRGWKIFAAGARRRPSARVELTRLRNRWDYRTAALLRR